VQDLVYSIYKYPRATKAGSGKNNITDTHGDQLL